jgi:hypothetical protein
MAEKPKLLSVYTKSLLSTTISQNSDIPLLFTLSPATVDTY